MASFGHGVQVSANIDGKLDVACEMGMDELLNVDLDTNARYHLDLGFAIQVHVDESGRLDVASDVVLENGWTRICNVDTVAALL